MADKSDLNHPWLVAVWPGMGAVALNAGIYLLAKLDMKLIAEQESDLFDVEHVEVKEGILQPGRRPRNRFFLWRDPTKKHDLIVFLGEAQPPLGKQTFCRQLLAYARQLGVERVFTFAAMATDMHPAKQARVFGAATDSANLEELKRLELEILNEGHIGGLNGILLGVAAEEDLQGACLLGEMPHMFSQLPFPKASLAILEVFTTVAGLDVDLAELADQAKKVEEQLGELLERVEGGGEEAAADEEGVSAVEASIEAVEEEKVSKQDKSRIEQLFKEAAQDRRKAVELKHELDRLGAFKDYEDRFLDLFKKSG